jgi:hypothetical protein
MMHLFDRSRHRGTTSPERRIGIAAWQVYWFSRLAVKPAAHLAVEVSQGETGASRTRRAKALAPAKAARVRTPAKAVPAAAAKPVSAHARSARKRSGVAARVSLRPRRCGRDWVGPVGEKLITVGQQMGNTTVKTSQR